MHKAGKPNENNWRTEAVLRVDSELNSPLSKINWIISWLIMNNIIDEGKIVAIASLYALFWIFNAELISFKNILRLNTGISTVAIDIPVSVSGSM